VALTPEELVKRVKQKVVPSGEERSRLAALVGKVVHSLQEAVAQRKVPLEVSVQGSYAKDTWLAGDVDIDVFLLADPSLNWDTVQTVVFEVSYALCKKFTARTRERYAEHPYLEAWIEGVRFNFVPGYLTKPGEWRTAVDRTPYHTEFVLRNLTEEQRDEVRVLKAFLKARRLYGAEIRFRGFSGYLCELLVAHYGGFWDVVRAMASWRYGEVVAFTPVDEDRIRRVFPEPLIVIDPVDPRRNVAAAVSDETFVRAIHAAMQLVEKPSLETFGWTAVRVAPVAVLDALRRRRTGIVGIFFDCANVVPDVLYGQLRRTLRILRAALEERGYTVLQTAMCGEEGRCMLVFELEALSKPAVRLLTGPPVSKPEAVHRFLERHLWEFAPQPVARGGRVFGVLPQPWRRASTIIEAIIRKSIEGRGPLPRYVTQGLRGGYKVLEGEDVIKEVRQRRCCLAELARLLGSA